MVQEYAAYFDDSGHPDSEKLVVVAGFVASKEQWLLFERDWEDLLRSEGLTALHMTDFMRNDWDKERKQYLLNRLTALLYIRTSKHFSETVLMDAYRTVNEKYAMEEVLGAPYALVGNNLSKKLRQWKAQHGGEDSKLLSIFEDGTKHKGDFIDAMARDALPCPIFAKKSEVTPLQGADLLAREIFTHLNMTKHSRLRPEFELLAKQPLDDGTYGVKELEEACETANVPLRSKIPSGVAFAHGRLPKKLRRRTIR